MNHGKSIQLKRNSKKLFFLIHGYTGSPTDFNELPDYLSTHHDADIEIMLLHGHGTRIEDLDALRFQNFLDQVEGGLQKKLQEYDQIILGGVSFGAQLALILASRYPVQGVFHVCIPYQLRFPFNLSLLSLVGYFKKYWPKSIPKDEKKLREKAFHYKAMHINGLRIVHEANQEIEKSLENIRCPVITVHSSNDPLSDYKAIHSLEDRLRVPYQKEILHDKNHNIFFSESRFEVYKIILIFFQKNIQTREKDTVAAIVPAYNEAKRISSVLTALSQTKILDEIIVVDDGSHDNTEEVVSHFPSVKFLKNQKNIGKAESLQRGVDSTQANVLFFCDADLQNITPEIITEIISPVLTHAYDMFIGIRDNIMQKSVPLFAINSGERALRRELWEKLPKSFKHRYRIEAGLNFIAKHKGKGFGYKKFPYYQTLKEKKYGFFKGTMLRWWMNFDVATAYFLALLFKK